MTSTPNTERVNPHHCNQCGEGEPRPTLPAKPVPPRAPAGKSRSRSALPAPGGRSAVGTELTQNWNCTGTKPAWRWYSTGHRTGTAPAHRLGQQRVWRWHRRLQHSEPRGAERRDGSRSSALARPWHSSGVVLTSCRAPAYILAREQSPAPATSTAGGHCSGAGEAREPRIPCAAGEMRLGTGISTGN